MKKPNIIHVMADGKRLDSIEGRVIPQGNPAYRILLEAGKKAGKIEEWKRVAG